MNKDYFRFNIFLLAFLSVFSIVFLQVSDACATTLHSKLDLTQKIYSHKGYFASSPLLKLYLEKLHISSRDLDLRNFNLDLPYVEGEVLVTYKKGTFNLSKRNSDTAEDAFLRSKNLKAIERLEDYNISRAKIEDGKTVEEKIKELSVEPNIERVQPNYIYTKMSIDTNDTYKSYLWGLDNYGQTVNGQVGLIDKDIDAPEAWEVLKRNNNEVVVAIIDSGVNYYNYELADTMWDGSNCVDELNQSIGGGCEHGYDYDKDDNDPLPDWGESHGTHIAGTIAAHSNNGYGVTGLAPNVKIMAIKMNYVTTSSAINGISFAKYNGAKIINASWGGSYNDLSLKNAIEAFPGLFIAAAGNDGNNHDSFQNIYPCDYDLSNIICVAATDSRDELASFSDYGAISVDVGAPGVSILSTVTDPRFEEDFDTFYNYRVPTGWVKDGIGSSSWGTYSDPFNDYGKVLCTDTYACNKFYYYPYYESWANSTLTSTVFDMSKTDSALLDFIIMCDTEYSIYSWTDYLMLEVTGDGYNYIPLAIWDESDLDEDTSSSGFAGRYEMIDIPPEFYTTNFQFRFRWVTNGVDNYHRGCYIDYLDLARSGYDFYNGTSMAAPHVSGIAGLIWGYRPNLTTSQVKDAILNTGDNAPSLVEKTVTGKRVNVNNALISVQGDIISTFIFNYKGIDYSCLVNEKNLKIECRLPADYPKSSIAPTISLTGGTINPLSEVLLNFIQQQSYTYTKGDSTTETYNVDIQNFLSGMNAFRSGVGNWSVPNAKFMTSGDFDGDGKDDVGIMYDYGNKDMGLIVFTSSGDTMSGDLWFRSGEGNWSVPNARFMSSGDYNGDGKDDIGIMYDYGDKDMGLIVFLSDGIKLGGNLWFRSGEGNWSVPNAKFVTGSDFNDDGKGDMGIMYDYGNRDMGLIVFLSDGSKLNGSLWFRSGAGNWSVPNAKFVSSADYNGDGKGDIGIMYDYGSKDMGLIIFLSEGSTLSGNLWFRSGAGNWSVPNAKFMTSVDYNEDGTGDIGIMYDYGNRDMGLIVFESSGDTMAAGLWFRSGAGNWSVPNAKFVTGGDYNGNGIGEFSIMYDYGNNDMSLILFR